MREMASTSTTRRQAYALRLAGVMVAGLGAMTAFGCSPAADNAASSSAAAEAEDSTQATLAMEYDDGSDMFNHKSVEVTDKAQIGEGAQFVNGLGAENTYVYKGLAHGDGAHYSMYSLYTELVTDDEGMLTAINLTSGNDTWANKWGALGGQPAIYGTLPDGVTFDCEQTTDGDNTVLTPALSVEPGTEADAAGYKISGIYLYNVQDDLSTAGMDIAGRKGGTTHYEYDATVTLEDESAQASGESREKNARPEGADGSEGSSERSGERSGHGESSESGEAAAAETNAPEPTGYSYDAATGAITVEGDAYNLIQIRYTFGTEVNFDEYIVIGENENAAKYVEKNTEETDFTVPSKVEGTAMTNRTKWTYSMLSLITQRQFASWGSTFEDTSLYTGGNDGEIGDIDTISGATKTSVPFQSALNAAIDAGYVKGIAENVTATIDGGSQANDGIDVSAVQQDQTTVTKDENGNYVINVKFPAGVDESAGGDVQHAISPTNVDLYALGGEKLGTLGVWNLGKGTAGFTPVASYADASGTPGDADDSFVTYVSDWEYPYNPTITIKDPSVTHVVVSFSIGHETLGIAYDLAAMAAASEVTEMIDALDAKDASAVKAARDAYDALTNDVKGTVSNLDKLIEAEGK